MATGLHERIVEELDAPHGIVITDPAYSIEQRFQIVVPILNALTVVPSGHDVPIGEATTTWLEDVNDSYSEAFLWTEAVFSVFQPDEIIGYTKLCIDDGTLRELEQALTVYFEL